MKRLRLFAALSVLTYAAFFPILFPTPAHATEGLTAQVHNVLGQNGSPYIPQGDTATVTTNVPNIDFQWGSGSVLGGPSEDVIVRFTGSIRSNTTQDISFLAEADDGTRLYIDGVLIADDWVDKGGGGTISTPVSFTAGVPKTIELMYYENGGGAWVQLSWDQSGSMQVIPAEAFTSQAAPVVKTIGPPRNLTITSSDTSTVLTWEAPDTGNTQPERYAISFNCSGCNGWGIATGNVGGPNSLNTTITIDHSLLDGLRPAGTVWSFHIRSDNDTLALYSENSNVVTGVTYVAPTPTPSPSPSDTPTATVEPTPTQTSTPQPSPTPEPSTSTAPSPEPSPTPTPVAPVPSPSPTPEPTPAPSPEPSVQPSPTPQPSLEPSPNPEPSPTPVPVEPTPTPTIPPAVEPEPTPTPTPTTPPVDPQPTIPPVVPSEPVPTTPTEPPTTLEPELPPEPGPEPVPEPPVETEPPVAIPDPDGAIGGPSTDPATGTETPLEPTEELPPAVEPEEPPVVTEEPPLEVEPPVEEETPPVLPEPEPENPSTEPLEPPIEEEKPSTEAEEVSSAVEDVLSDGTLSAADSEAVMEALNADGEVTAEEVSALSEALSEDGKLTTAEKELVAEALIESVAPGETLTTEQIQDAGIEYKDLPEETPVEVRQDEEGNEVIITADVAAALVLLENPSELIGAIFSDPGEALQAFASIGADMSTEEREESTKAVVATVIAAGAAINAVGAAAGAASGSTGGSTGGGGASGQSGYRRKP